MKSKVIDFEKGLSGLKHRRGGKKGNDEKDEELELQKNQDRELLKRLVDGPKSFNGKKTEDSSAPKTIKFPSKNEKIQALVLELASLQQKLVSTTGKNAGKLDMEALKDNLEGNPAIDRIMDLVMELSEVTGYTLDDLLLGGKLQEIIISDPELKKKFFFDHPPHKPDLDALLNFSRNDRDDDDDDDDDDEDDDDEIIDFNMTDQSRTYYVNGREIVISKRLQPFQSINIVRTRIKEIIVEIYDTFLEDPLLVELTENPKVFKKLNPNKREYVNNYFHLVEELEDLSGHEAPDPFLKENLRKLAKRYHVKLKF